MKNLVERNWKFHSMKEAKEYLEPEELKSNKVIIFKEDEREQVRKHILNAISQVPSLEVLAQLEEVVFFIAVIDLP